MLEYDDDEDGGGAKEGRKQSTMAEGDDVGLFA